MPLKPNILEKMCMPLFLKTYLFVASIVEFSIPPPPPPQKYLSVQDTIVLEDEPGRSTLVGDRLEQDQYVIGIIMAALGTETPDGESEVVDACFPGMVPQINGPVTKSGDYMDVDGTLIFTEHQRSID